MYVHKLKIGEVETKNNVFLAPMAGVTDKPFRIISEKYGNPGLVYTEMASAKAIFYGDEKTKNLLDVENETRPIAMQIFGSDPKVMASSAKQIEEKADIIDINMGCPAPKVVKNGDGSKLLLNLDLIGNIVSEVVNATSKPVTVKLRKGWDDKNIVAVEAAKVIEKAGAKAITIHGRTREQYYGGTVDKDIIKKVKKAVDIPVIGNGDIKCTQDAIKMFEYTGVDGIMIGRATLGNPWLINNIVNELTDKKFVQIANEEKLKVMIEHLALSIQEKGEYIAIREMRKHLSWYIKNSKDSSKMRDKINRIEQKDELIDCLIEYFKSI